MKFIAVHKYRYSHGRTRNILRRAAKKQKARLIQIAGDWLRYEVADDFRITAAKSQQALSQTAGDARCDMAGNE